MSTPPTLAEVAGRNAKQIRDKVTLEQMAKACRHYELPWTIGRVGSFESGSVNPTLPTLLAVCAALRTITGKPVKLSDLFAGTGHVTLKGKLTMSLPRLREALSDEPVKIAAVDRLAAAGEAAEADYRSWRPALQRVDPALRVRVLTDFAEGDRELARSLKITDDHAAAAMAHKWRRTFVAERNKRAGENANPQQRGHVSRELKAELREVLDGDN